MTSRSSTTLSCLIVLLTCAACDPSTDPGDAGPDAAMGDDAGSEDAGHPDAGLDASVPDASVPDAGFDASMPDAHVPDAGFDAGDDDDGELQCKAESGPFTTAPCEDTPTELVPLLACCDEAARGACGATLPAIPGSPLSGCFAKDRPGNPSQHCGAFFDQLDAPLGHSDPGDDGAYTFTIGADVVALPGCCTPTGQCGAIMDELHIQGTSLGLGFGCIPYDRFRAPPTDENPDADAGAAPAPTLPPFCVPQRSTADVACPPRMDSMPTNLCDTLAAEGFPLLYCDPEAETPHWVCQTRGWPLMHTGEVPVLMGAACMEFLPTSIHGCGAGQSGEGCVPNIDTAIAGCVKPLGR